MPEIKRIAKIASGQDGAIWNEYLFRFDGDGSAKVYRVEDILQAGRNDVAPISQFMLDRAEEIAPHSNAVVFGTEYAEPGDEFPLLYSNIYNNFAKAENPLKGVCLVYRLTRDGESFSTKLLQMIAIGFTEDSTYWCSENGDIRPYGNFVIDREKGIYHAFTMIDDKNVSRYFSFDLPKLSDGEIDEVYGVKKVVLETTDIKDSFDCPYHRFIQGACCHKGKIYSVEGFAVNTENEPGLRVIDVENKAQELYVRFSDYGPDLEPEWIDFYEHKCIYSDAHGNVFEITF